MKMWIARNKSRKLYMYGEKPTLFENAYYLGTLTCILDKEMFPEVTFENSPIQVELKLIKEE